MRVETAPVLVAPTEGNRAKVILRLANNHTRQAFPSFISPLFFSIFPFSSTSLCFVPASKPPPSLNSCFRCRQGFHFPCIPIIAKCRNKDAEDMYLAFCSSECEEKVIAHNPDIRVITGRRVVRAALEATLSPEAKLGQEESACTKASPLGSSDKENEGAPRPPNEENKMPTKRKWNENAADDAGCVAKKMANMEPVETASDITGESDRQNSESSGKSAVDDFRKVPMTEETGVSNGIEDVDMEQVQRKEAEEVRDTKESSGTTDESNLSLPAMSPPDDDDDASAAAAHPEEIGLNDSVFPETVGPRSPSSDAGESDATKYYEPGEGGCPSARASPDLMFDDDDVAENPGSENDRKDQETESHSHRISSSLISELNETMATMEENGGDEPRESSVDLPLTAKEAIHEATTEEKDQANNSEPSKPEEGMALGDSINEGKPGSETNSDSFVSADELAANSDANTSSPPEEMPKEDAVSDAPTPSPSAATANSAGIPPSAPGASADSPEETRAICAKISERNLKVQCKAGFVFPPEIMDDSVVKTAEVFFDSREEALDLYHVILELTRSRFRVIEYSPVGAPVEPLATGNEALDELLMRLRHDKVNASVFDGEAVEVHVVHPQRQKEFFRLFMENAFTRLCTDLAERIRKSAAPDKETAIIVFPLFAEKKAIIQPIYNGVVIPAALSRGLAIKCMVGSRLTQCDPERMKAWGQWKWPSCALIQVSSNGAGGS